MNTTTLIVFGAVLFGLGCFKFTTNEMDRKNQEEEEEDVEV